MDYYWLSPCARLTDFLTSSVFCLDVGFPTCSDWNYVRFPTCRHYRAQKVATYWGLIYPAEPKTDKINKRTKRKPIQLKRYGPRVAVRVVSPDGVKEHTIRRNKDQIRQLLPVVTIWRVPQWTFRNKRRQTVFVDLFTPHEIADCAFSAHFYPARSGQQQAPTPLTSS